MTRLLVCLAAAVAVFYVAIPLDETDPPRFEGADVHPSALSTSSCNPFMQGPFVGGGRFEVRKATMLDLIRLGWSVQADKIVGGPAWIRLDRFDILAKAPAGASSSDLRVMLQNLLAERFALKVHQDTKPMPTFALVVAPGKKSHLKEADGAGNTGCKAQESASAEGSGRIMFGSPDGTVTTLAVLPGNLIQYTCRSVSMAAFACGLHGMFGANVVEDAISDVSVLKGAWNFDMKFSFNMNGPMMATLGSSVFHSPTRWRSNWG